MFAQRNVVHFSIKRVFTSEPFHPCTCTSSLDFYEKMRCGRLPSRSDVNTRSGISDYLRGGLSLDISIYNVYMYTYIYIYINMINMYICKYIYIHIYTWLYGLIWVHLSWYKLPWVNTSSDELISVDKDLHPPGNLPHGCHWNSLGFDATLPFFNAQFVDFPESPVHG